MNKGFDSEPIYGDNKYLWAKIKEYRDKINTNFQGKKISKENECYKCLSLIILVTKMNKEYYPQTLLEECKYQIKKRATENLVNDEFDSSSSDESDNESDNEESNGCDNEESSD